jgi:isopenicillin N synthase-like dioxygenase
MNMSDMNPDLTPVADSAVVTQSVPIIDLGGAKGMQDPATAARIAGEIGNACRDWGFFQIINHGVDAEHLDRVWQSIREFFALPRAEKRALNRKSENPWGYFDRELTKNQRDKKEIFDIGPEFDMGATCDDPFSGATPWPTSQPIFETAMRTHFKICEKLSITMVDAICLSLDLQRDRLKSSFEPTHTSFLRLNYYPVEDPLSDLPEEAGNIADLGIHYHSDAGAVTILIQDHVGGLQVFKDGGWYDVEPIAGAFVVNIGDMVQVWSNDKYRAALHRVQAMSSIDRYSFPFFYNPAYGAVVEPLECAKTPILYQGIDWGEFRRKRADGDYANVGKEVQISDYRVTTAE